MASILRYCPFHAPQFFSYCSVATNSHFIAYKALLYSLICPHKMQWRILIIAYFVFLRFVNLTVNIAYSHYKYIINCWMSFKTVLHPSLSPFSKVSAGIESHRLTTATCQLRWKWSKVSDVLCMCVHLSYSIWQ